MTERRRVGGPCSHGLPGRVEEGPMKIEIKNRFSGAVLFGVEAESWRVAVEIAVKQGANLGGANRGGAKLWGAKVLGIASVGYIDGWPTTLWRTDWGYRLQAGCHTFTLDEAIAHYADREERRGLYYLATEAWRVIARLQGWEMDR